MQAAQAAAAAIGSNVLTSSSSTTNDEKENKPSIDIVQQAFSTFGEVRCCDIPCLDPFRSLTNPVGVNVPLPQETTFDAFIQFTEYIGFVKAMDACRNMKLLLIDENNVAHTANIKVKRKILLYIELKRIFPFS